MNFYKNIYNYLINYEKPSEYLIFLRSKSYISYLPELSSLIGTPQDPVWHPEGDVWTHTLMVIDKASEFRNEFYYLDDFGAFMLGALCHDFGKPYTTLWDKGRWRSPKHDIIGLIPTATFLNKLGINEDIKKVVFAYVLEHLKPMQLYKTRDSITDAAIIKLQNRINIPNLIMLAKADHYGRTTDDALELEAPHCDWLLNKYNELIVNSNF